MVAELRGGDFPDADFVESQLRRGVDFPSVSPRITCLVPNHNSALDPFAIE